MRDAEDQEAERNRGGLGIEPRGNPGVLPTRERGRQARPRGGKRSRWKQALGAFQARKGSGQR